MMTTIAFPKDRKQDEKRCALMHSNLKANSLLGLEIILESGLGEDIVIYDEAYEAAGATVLPRDNTLAAGDRVRTVNKHPFTGATISKHQAD